MGISKPQVAIIQVARRQLGIYDADYLAILQRSAGVTSSKDLDSYGFDAVMDEFQRLGFVSTSSRKPFGDFRNGMASNNQCRLIRRLWSEWTGGQGDDVSLGKWLERTFHVSAFRFLTAASAQKAIAALKKMNDRKAKSADPQAA